MDHGAVIRTWRRAPLRIALTLAALLLALPASANATGATLVTPADGQHFDHLELAPMVQFDPSNDADGNRETPRWVLLASDPDMKTTVRYCRQFVWAMEGTTYHWGCNRWATGVDQLGNDQLLALEPGKVYYWQVVSKSNVDGAPDIVSDVRAFAIDAEPAAQSIADVSNQVYGTAFDDGTQLNLGAAAYVNSGVRVKDIHTTRLAFYAFRVHVQHLGTIDKSRSYVKISSAAGTRYVRLTGKADAKAFGLIRLTAKERRLKTKRFTYQAFLKSTVNGSLVKSPPRVLLVRAPKKAPKWTPDR
ncbi:MAG: hypothetical protein KDC46_11755 [Thermoleophilia bacterium]|nr:hypothetical protein [Thermoleophilia bacterium]